MFVKARSSMRASKQLALGSSNEPDPSRHLLPILFLTTPPTAVPSASVRPRMELGTGVSSPHACSRQDGRDTNGHSSSPNGCQQAKAVTGSRPPINRQGWPLPQRIGLMLLLPRAPSSAPATAPAAAVLPQSPCTPRTRPVPSSTPK